jgi:parvulin-like peptidyl-prolyl isomerase
MSKGLPQLKRHRIDSFDSAFQVYIDKVVGNRPPDKIDRTLEHVKYREEKLNEVKGLKH